MRSEGTTKEFNSTMQVNMILDSSGLIGFGLLLVNRTESGAGTKNNMACLKQYRYFNVSAPYYVK